MKSDLIQLSNARQQEIEKYLRGKSKIYEIEKKCMHVREENKTYSRKSWKSFIIIFFLQVLLTSVFLSVGQSGAGNNQAKERYTEDFEPQGKFAFDVKRQ